MDELNLFAPKRHADFIVTEKRTCQMFFGVLCVFFGFLALVILVPALRHGFKSGTWIELGMLGFGLILMNAFFIGSVKMMLKKARVWQEEMTAFYNQCNPISTDVEITIGSKSTLSQMKIYMRGEATPVEMKVWCISALYPPKGKQYALVRMDAERSKAVVEVGDARFWCTSKEFSADKMFIDAAKSITQQDD